MMMSKPAPESSQSEEKPADAVADLERRLAMLSSAETEAAPAFAVAPKAAAPTTTTAAPSSKNALLVSDLLV